MNILARKTSVSSVTISPMRALSLRTIAERWSRTNAIGSLHGRCRVHRAEILRLRGACDEAEREALVACEELSPYLRREMGWPLSELGRIRLRKGDIDGAEEALLAAGRRRAAAESAVGQAMEALAIVQPARDARLELEELRPQLADLARAQAEVRARRLERGPRP